MNRKYPSREEMIKELLVWFGWREDMLLYLKSIVVLKAIYRIMLKEKEE